MRFEVSYSSGTKHEVQLAGSVVVLGRDPGCDVVLNDTKCSRRHAVVEDTPDGFVVRDSGSANGVFVNERRVDRAFVKPGDTIRLGDVRLRLLAEIGETVIVALDDVELPAAAPQDSLTHPPFAAPAERDRPSREPASREGALARPPSTVPDPASRRAEVAPPAAPKRDSRPPTVSLLAGLWALGGPGACAAIAFVVWRLHPGPLGWALAALLGLLLVALAVTMALGLRALSPWARHLQVASAYLGLLACPFTPAAATTLLYMNRADVKRSFEAGGEGAGAAETTFALSITVMILVGVVASAVASFLVWPVR